MTSPRRRMRSTGVTIGVTAVVAAGLTGCSSSSDYAAVCVDPQTQERVDDDECDDADDNYTGSNPSGGFFWYYIAANRSFPGVGSRVSGGSFDSSSASGKVSRGGLSDSGGSSVKSATKTGGFGGSGKGSS